VGCPIIIYKKKENDEFYRGLDILYDDDDIIRYGLEFSRNKKKQKSDDFDY
jgi:hypothetical protein